MNKSETIAKLAEALSKCQSELEVAIKDTKGGFGKYADLAEVWRIAKAPLTTNGLAVSQVGRVADPIYVGTEAVKFGVILETVLMHSSGEWMSGEQYAPCAKNDAQAIGSCTSYLRRYGLAAILGIVQDDDDGNAASGNKHDRNVDQERSQPQQRASAPPASYRKPAPAPDNTPTHTGTAPAETAEQLSARIFGTGPALKRKDEFVGLCKELNALGVKNKEGNLWGPKGLEEYSQDGFDKAFSQLDEEEVEVMVNDLILILEERKALVGESEPAVTSPAKEPEAGSLKPPTKNQIETLRKLCDIKDLNEVELMQGISGGNHNSFDEISSYDDAYALIQKIQKGK